MKFADDGSIETSREHQADKNRVRSASPSPSPTGPQALPDSCVSPTLDAGRASSLLPDSPTPSTNDQPNEPLNFSALHRLAELQTLLYSMKEASHSNTPPAGSSSGTELERGSEDVGPLALEQHKTTEQEASKPITTTNEEVIMKLNREGNAVVVPDFPEYKRVPRVPVRIFLEDCFKTRCEEYVAIFNNIGIPTMHELDLIIDYELDQDLLGLLSDSYGLNWFICKCISRGLAQRKAMRARSDN